MEQPHISIVYGVVAPSERAGIVLLGSLLVGLAIKLRRKNARYRIPLKPTFRRSQPFSLYSRTLGNRRGSLPERVCCADRFVAHAERCRGNDFRANEQARFVIRELLESAGYDVVEADSEAGAAAVCERPEQRIDLVVSDLILSSAKGTEVSERLSELRPGLPIVFISGYGIEDLVSRKLLEPDRFQSTMVSLLQKPFQPQVFLENVQKLIAGSNL